MVFQKIAVIGGGAWGTALAVTALRAGRSVRIWARQEKTVACLLRGENPESLPGLSFPPLHAVRNLSDLRDCDAILWACPVQPSRQLLGAFSTHARPGLPVALCAKGLEHGSGKLMSQILQEEIEQAIPAVLSGPSFATDLVRGLPAAVTLACSDEEEGQRWLHSLGHAQFRPYFSRDLVGTQIGGAVKNVLAIACGIATGLELGDSARAALIARGFAEMTRLGVAMGADSATLSGLCGLGDLLLTCTSGQSRNMSFGMALGRGETTDNILAERHAVTEGVLSAPAVIELAGRQGVKMPVCQAVASILHEKISVAEAINSLMARPFTNELSV